MIKQKTFKGRKELLKSLNIIKKPLFLSFALPGLYLLFGTIYATPYSSINLFSFFVFYLYLILNQTIESKMRRYFILKKDALINQYWLTEFLILMCLSYFMLVHSLTAGLLLFSYTLFAQGKYLSIYYKLDLLSIILLPLLKTFLLNSFSFYIHTGFIPNQVLYIVVPLLIPAFLLEATSWQEIRSKRLMLALLIMTYFVTLMMTWSHYAWWSLISLISMVTVPILWKHPSYKTTLFFVFCFSANYLILITIGTLFIH